MLRVDRVDRAGRLDLAVGVLRVFWAQKETRSLALSIGSNCFTTLISEASALRSLDFCFCSHRAPGSAICGAKQARTQGEWGGGARKGSLGRRGDSERAVRRATHIREKPAREDVEKVIVR